VDIDKGQISQVVQNIILNASDAMPNGGTIEVTCQNVSSANALSAAMNQSANYVELKVKDTGIGIPQESLDKIFDPYFTGKKQGTGLGLAITHSIVSKHDGYISVKSTEGVGSTFMVYLPAATSEPALAQETEAVGVKTRKARIMVMDDEELVRNVTREMLVELGHEVLLVSDGAQALQTYQATIQNGLPIDLIIMDLTVPGGMGGQEAVQKILAIDSQAKVIVSSGYSNDPIMAYYEEFGFSAAISKPHQLDDLAKVIGVLID
jgi:CheY-like chemotaxis protein